ADKRLTPIGRQIGLVTDERYRVFEERWSAVEAVRERLGASRVGCTEAVQEVLRRLGTQPLRRGQALTLAELLKRPEITWAKLVEVDPGLADVDEDRKSTRLNSSHVKMSYA